MPAVDYRKYEGQTLNRTYCLDRLIKRGGMGAVFEASHSRLPEKKFAVKILYIDAEDDPEIATRFRQEAEVTSRLRHENIVEVLDYDETDDGVPYLVMELLEGEELGARLRRVKRPFDLPTAQTIFEQAAAGLGAAHAAGIVHRDVKPSNLFIIPRGNGELIKVLDFGVSKIVGAQTSITRTQMSIGTPRYMAPEQARGEAGGVDARADIFALSTIFYEMLAGRHCFRGQSIPEILYKIVHEHPDPIETLRPDLPPAVINTIRWGLCKRRRDRPQSMSELLQVTRGLAPPPQEVLDAGAETMISHSQVTGPLAPVGDLPTRGRVHTGPMTPPPLDPGLASFEQQTLASLTPSGASAVNPHQQSTASLRPRQPATTGPMRPYETAETAELEAAPTVMTPTPSSLSARGVALYGDGSHSHSSHSHSGHSRGSGSVPVGYGSGASYGSHASFGSSASFGTAQGPSDSTLSAGTGQVAPIASPPPSRSSAALRWGGLAFATAAVGALVVVLVLRVTDPSRGSGAGSGSAIAANTGSAANTANAAGSGSAEGSASAAGSA
ncbi:MAG: protein kinase, partial [Myxococcales bacterium]|nr:protein kinase [Myxococcales bacterium]